MGKARKRQSEAQRAASKALRATRGKALRYSQKLEKAGFSDAATELKFIAGRMTAGGTRSYGSDAKAAEKEAIRTMARFRAAEKSAAIFNSELNALASGQKSALTQGMGIGRLEKMKPRPAERTVRTVDRRGRVTGEETKIVDRQQEAMEMRGRMMSGVFFQAEKSVWEEGPYSSRATTIALEHGTTAEKAWKDFWHQSENRTVAKYIDSMSRAWAVHGTTGDEAMDALFAGSSIIGSPTLEHIIREAQRWAEQRGER